MGISAGELVVLLAIVAALAGIIAFVAKDARRHGYSATPWILLIVFANVVGVIAYAGWRTLSMRRRV